MPDFDELLCFDTETTDATAATAGIVTAFLGILTPEGVFRRTKNWLVKPHIPITPGAEAVHGVSNEIANRDGMDSALAIQEIVAALEKYRDLPLVIYNAPFDLTLTAAEARRNGLTFEVGDRLIIDPLVIDRGVDKYRKGSRKLGDTAKHYGVEVEGALHDAEVDSLNTGLIAQKVLTHPSVKDLTAEQLMTQQAEWHRAWAVNFQDYLTRMGKDASGVNEHWPIAPLP